MKKIKYVLALVLISAVLISGCINFDTKIQQTATQPEGFTKDAKDRAQEIIVKPTVEPPSNIPVPFSSDASAGRISVTGYVLLFPNVPPNLVKSQYDYDYIVRVTFRNNGPDTLIFDTARAYFELGGSSLVIERKAEKAGSDKWRVAPYEIQRLDFWTKGSTAEFHNITRKTGKKVIKFSVGILNDGKLIDRPYTADIPELDKLTNSSLDAVIDNSLTFSPIIFEKK